MMSKVQEEINTIAICGSQTMGTSKYSIQLNPVNYSDSNLQRTFLYESFLFKKILWPHFPLLKIK